MNPVYAFGIAESGRNTYVMMQVAAYSDREGNLHFDHSGPSYYKSMEQLVRSIVSSLSQAPPIAEIALVGVAAPSIPAADPQTLNAIREKLRTELPDLFEKSGAAPARLKAA
jgi:hypothetical protein